MNSLSADFFLGVLTHFRSLLNKCFNDLFLTFLLFASFPFEISSLASFLHLLEVWILLKLVPCLVDGAANPVFGFVVVIVRTISDRGGSSFESLVKNRSKNLAEGLLRAYRGYANASAPGMYDKDRMNDSGNTTSPLFITMSLPELTPLFTTFLFVELLIISSINFFTAPFFLRYASSISD